MKSCSLIQALFDLTGSVGLLFTRLKFWFIYFNQTAFNQPYYHIEFVEILKTFERKCFKRHFINIKEREREVGIGKLERDGISTPL